MQWTPAKRFGKPWFLLFLLVLFKCFVVLLISVCFKSEVQWECFLKEQESIVGQLQVGSNYLEIFFLKVNIVKIKSQWLVLTRQLGFHNAPREHGKMYAVVVKDAFVAQV